MELNGLNDYKELIMFASENGILTKELCNLITSLPIDKAKEVIGQSLADGKGIFETVRCHFHLFN